MFTHEDGLHLMLNTVRMAQDDNGTPVAICVTLKQVPQNLVIASHLMGGNGPKILEGAACKCDAALLWGRDTVLLEGTWLEDWTDDKTARAVWRMLLPHTKGGGVLIADPDDNSIVAALGVEGRMSQQNHDLALRAARAMKLYPEQ